MLVSSNKIPTGFCLDDLKMLHNPLFVAFVAVYLTPLALAQSITALKYTSVGGSGSYQQVTDMIPGVFPSCNVTPSCIQNQMMNVSGNLAPFDEDVSIVFAGPMNLYNIAVYQPDSGT